MPALCYRQNAGNVELYPDSRGETVRVWKAGGDCKYVRWLGFIDRDKAKSIRGARPVKLDVNRYTNAEWGDWVDVKKGEYVQGCLTDEGVYGVTTPHVRIVTQPKKPESPSAQVIVMHSTDTQI